MSLEQRLPPAEPWPYDFYYRHGTALGTLPGNLGADEKMGHARSQLGVDLRGAGHHVPRQADPELAADRNRKEGCTLNRRQP